ncbi:transcription factor IBH1-like 1 isoform X2 [Dioscorea cayenensis subsp. rotundata]|uniref:Transcription factor IBH1-like 1 isoform X2 n=1 Tax=Dioscorea cayennensis subsp. rotundata TaxID=55577 RepID=A0AB40D373_DIOCR|nr:transcription factor IBH1-like 1 isoform X2 [Dioscorea cayenensis subsp. rotundata]
MHGSNTFMQVFFKKWLLGLKHGGISSKNMSFLERKRTIKVSSDIAMAFAKHGRTWSQALVTNLSKQEENKAMVNAIFEDVEYHKKKSSSSSSPRYHDKPCYNTRSKKILRRSLQVCSMVRKRRHKKPSNGVVAMILAKDLVKKRTKLLKRLVPGGDSMDDFSLLDETFDYIISLQAQVDLMHLLAKVLGVLNTKN